MKWLPLLCWPITLLTTLAPAVLPAAEPPEFQKREFAIEGAEPLKYVVYVPKNLSADKPIPFLIFLHGHADDCITHERILKESNLQFWHGYDKDVQREPTLLMAPVGGTAGWTSDVRQKAVFGIIDALIQEFPVDKRRIYLQGFSMGGGGTWQYLQARPGFFAAANPQAAAPRSLDVEKVKNTPIWATIGAQDPGNERLTPAIASLRAANGDDRGGLTQVTGVNPRYNIFADTDHGGAQVATQQLPGFADWMYSQVNDGNIPPNVHFTDPKIGAASEARTVKASAAAADPDGKIAKVEFYLGDKLIQSVTEAPYECTYPSLPDGPQLLKAKATDSGGKSRTDELTIQIGKPPAPAASPAAKPTTATQPAK